MSTTLRTGRWVAATLVLALFCLPLVVDLNEPEMRSDEAIYSYAVQRILETNDWLTPRSIPGDGPFLEKPPLKLWIVAAGMRVGLLPPSDAGMRRFDGFFGAIAFLYIFLIGCRLSGTACGVISVFVVFTFDPLLFEHGLRSNNMEASVFLCYCGGIYHFSRWVETARKASRRWHTFAAAGYFILGFMTKFVAALFLPLVCVATLAWGRKDEPGAWSNVRDWMLPTAVTVIVIMPWFLYETHMFGLEFWHIIFGVHIFKRFTNFLDPAHLQPWHYYLSGTWREVATSGSQILVGVGLARLVYKSIRGQSWLARLILVWGTVPLILISIGTSKLMHYAYPFWPPLGLASGLAFTWGLCDVEKRAARWTALQVSAYPRPWYLSLIQSNLKGTLAFLCLLLTSIALWSFAAGRIELEVHGITVFRNSSFVRPMILALFCCWLSIEWTDVPRLVASIALAALLPINAYIDKINKIERVDHPIRAARDCINAVHSGGALVGGGVMNASGVDVLHHAYYYYLWRTGAWVVVPHFSLPDALDRLVIPGRQTPVLIARSDYFDLIAALQQRLTSGDSGVRTPQDALTAPLGLSQKTVTFDDNVAIVLPGPFGACAESILAAGGHPIWKDRSQTLR